MRDSTPQARLLGQKSKNKMVLKRQEVAQHQIQQSEELLHSVIPELSEPEYHVFTSDGKSSGTDTFFLTDSSEAHHLLRAAGES